MSYNQNVKFVRNNLDKYIYESMRLARYNVTKEFCKAEPDLNSEEGIALRNFKKTYKFILETHDLEPNYEYLLDIHTILMNGLLANINNELTEDQVEYLYKMINQPAKSNTEIAIDVMLYILDKRLFEDGDVRAAVLFANKIMIENGCGFISIPVEKDDEFRAFIKEAKVRDNSPEFKKWIATYCIKGVKNDY